MLITSLTLMIGLAGGSDNPPAVAPPADTPAAGATAGMTENQKKIELANLLARVDSTDAATREEAIGKLSRLDMEDVGPPITKLMRQTKNGDAQRVILRMFRQAKYEGAYRETSQLLANGDDPKVRREACHALAELHPADAVTQLRLAAMIDGDARVRRAAILDLGAMDRLDATLALVDVMERVVDEEDEYLLSINQRALKSTTGKDFGTNLEAWYIYVRQLEEKDDLEEVDLEEDDLDDARD